MRRRIRNKRGFTLVEIMIAVGILILLFALSIHSLIRARITANESAAIKSLRTLHVAFTSYRAVNPTYPTDYRDLCNTIPPYLDSKWIGSDPIMALRQGYIFDIKSAEADRFMIMAAPWQDGVTGIRVFFIDQGGEITNDGIGLGAASPQ